LEQPGHSQISRRKLGKCPGYFTLGRNGYLTLIADRSAVNRFILRISDIKELVVLP
jgi:hypothetical protein